MKGEWWRQRWLPSADNYAEDEDGEEMKIKLYPSLQFGWDLPQFQTVAGEYLKEDAETVTETEPGQDPDPAENLAEFEEEEG